MKCLLFCNTYYHVLITVLKRINGCIPYDTEVVISQDIPEGQNLTKKLKESELFADILYYEKKYPKEGTLEYLFYHEKLMKHIEREFPLHLEEFEEIYVFHDAMWFSRYLKYKHIEYNVLEDGLNVFKFINRSAFSFAAKSTFSIKDRINRLLREDCRYYLDSKYVKSIEVNDKQGIVLRDDPRVVELPRQQLFDNLTEEDKKTLLKIFSVPGVSFNEENMAVVFTYPFVLDRLLHNEDEQLSIYKQLLEKYKRYNVYIKPHPRDTVNYDSLGCHVINKNFPSEILNFIDSSKIQKYISIETHCVDVYPSEKVDYYPLNDFLENQKNFTT